MLKLDCNCVDIDRGIHPNSQHSSKSLFCEALGQMPLIPFETFSLFSPGNAYYYSNFIAIALISVEC
jgi:hypothetical protein